MWVCGSERLRNVSVVSEVEGRSLVGKVRWKQLGNAYRDYQYSNLVSEVARDKMENNVI